MKYEKLIAELKNIPPAKISDETWLKIETTIKSRKRILTFEHLTVMRPMLSAMAAVFLFVMFMSVMLYLKQMETKSYMRLADSTEYIYAIEKY